MEDIKISDVTMHDVTTPLHLSIKPGNTADRISIDRLTATGVYRAAASIESWADNPVERVMLRDVSMEFTGGGTAEQAKAPVRSPGVDARPLPAWGLYARNVRTLRLENVRLDVDHPDARPAILAEHVKSLETDGLKAPPGEQSPVVLNDVGNASAAAIDLSPEIQPQLPPKEQAPSRNPGQ